MEFAEGDKFFKIHHGLVNKEEKYIIHSVMQIQDTTTGSIKWVATVVGEKEPFTLACRKTATDPHIVVYVSKCMF
jgi:hypothetical protein